MNYMKTIVAVAGTNASGLSDFFVTQVTVPQGGFHEGEHFNIAKCEAREAGYEKLGPCYDHEEHGALTWALNAIRSIGFEDVAAPGPARGEYLLACIETADAFTIDSSDVFSGYKTNEDMLYFHWYDSGDLRQSVIPEDNLNEAVPEAPGVWLVKDRNGRISRLKLFDLTPNC